jgi:hypothetical protein
MGGAAFLLARQTASPAPLGVPLPIPHSRFVTTGFKPDEADVMAGRIPPPWLEYLAPEPDGTLPLRYPYTSARGGFTIKHPFGATIMEDPGQNFDKTNEDALCLFSYNQPLKKIRYVMPLRQPGEQATEVAARLRYELQQKGAQLVPGRSDRLELPRYRFEHLEYTTKGDAGPEYHVDYLGPLGKRRVLLIDFVTTPELAEPAQRQIDKIMQSFTPELQLAEVMLLEDPAYGEWGNTKYVELARKQQAEWDKEEAAALAVAAKHGVKLPPSSPPAVPGQAGRPPLPEPKRKGTV